MKLVFFFSYYGESAEDADDYDDRCDDDGAQYDDEQYSDAQFGDVDDYRESGQARENQQMLEGINESYLGSGGFGEVSQPSYDSQSAQLTNDIAADESQPVVLHFIKNSSMGTNAKKRLIMRVSAFLSKNQVYSNIENLRDFQMVQDDFEYARILARTDFTSYDMTSDFLSAEAVVEAQHNIRLRRSRRALNLKQLNTSIQRTENVDLTESQDEKKLNRKFSFMGNSG